MRVVGFVGSPRKEGNTYQLVTEILEGAREQNAETQSYNLNELEINGCQSCFKCKEDDEVKRCVQQDDMQKLFDEIEAADVIVIGSPVYMWQMSGQTKIFLDRLMPYVYQTKLTNMQKKKLIIAFVQGAPDASYFQPYFDYTEKMFGMFQFSEQEIITAVGVGGPGDIQKQTEILKKARELGRKFASDIES